MIHVVRSKQVTEYFVVLGAHIQSIPSGCEYGVSLRAAPVRRTR
jgi:hypothetical protein